jgi:hypothetical protein
MARTFCEELSIVALVTPFARTDFNNGPERIANLFCVAADGSIRRYKAHHRRDDTGIIRKML